MQHCELEAYTLRSTLVLTGLQIHYWQGTEDINNAAWIVPLLLLLVIIQFFGVKGYGEVEFVISLIKICACTGFIILGIIIDCGGVPTDDRGYIGTQYW